jgi:hypothetical protein
MTGWYGCSLASMRAASGASPVMVMAPTGAVGHDEASLAVGLAWVAVY